MQDYYDKKNAIAIRRSVIQRLKSQGLDNYKIGLVLNITEYEVRKLSSPEGKREEDHAL